MKTIILNSRVHGKKTVLVDDEDYDRVKNIAWYVVKKKYVYYAGAHGSDRKHISMHRIVMNISNQSILVDHADGDGLNNQKSNLRLCNNSENMKNARLRKDNTSGFKGVNKTLWGTYRARIQVNGRTRVLGSFKTAEEAAKQFNEAAKVYYKEFAKLNQT